MSKELFEAIEKHDVDLLARLLREGADPNALKAEWPEWLPLQAAVDELAEGGPVEALTLLLRHGARVDEMGPDRTATALLMAIFRRQPEAVRMLLAVGADPNYQGSEGDSPLRACVEQGDLAMAALLLRCGAARTIDEAGAPSGMSALGRAASRLDLPMIELLLQAGAGPEAFDLDGQTARERLPPHDAGNQETWDAAAALLTGRSRGSARAMELDRSLMIHLREMATAGQGVCEMVRWLLEQLSSDASRGRIQAIAYLQQAFYLSAGDAAAAGAWRIFPGGTWSDEECEQFLLPRIHATRRQWA